MKYPGFVGPTYVSQSFDATADRTMNLYPEAVESGTGKNRYVFYGTPGLSLFANLPTSPVRGLLSAGSPLGSGARLFAVAGSKLYEVSSIGGYTLLGDVGNDAADSPVQMFANGSQLLIISAGQAYCDNGAGPVLIAALVDGAKTGAFLDGYGIVNPPDSKNIYISDLSDFASWDPLDVAVKEGYPDNIGSIITSHSELWIFGESTTEIWRNTGNADFPLEPDKGAFIHQGTCATWSPCRLMNGVAWLGVSTAGSVVAWHAEGFTPTRVSTHAVEQAWSRYEDSQVVDAISFSYVDNGHHFWVIQFPSIGATWVYDATTKMWHERGYWTGTAWTWHLARCHAYCFGWHIVGDRRLTSGRLFMMSPSTHTDNGDAIVWSRTAPHISEENKPISYSRFQLDMETGTASSAPDVTLQYSSDRGHTYTTGRTITAGAAADYKHRVIWRRLGRGRDRVFRVTSHRTGPVALVDAYLDVTPGK